MVTPVSVLRSMASNASQDSTSTASNRGNVAIAVRAAVQAVAKRMAAAKQKGGYMAGGLEEQTASCGVAIRFGCKERQIILSPGPLRRHTRKPFDSSRLTSDVRRIYVRKKIYEISRYQVQQYLVVWCRM